VNWSRRSDSSIVFLLCSLENEDSRTVFLEPWPWLRRERRRYRRRAHLDETGLINIAQPRVTIATMPISSSKIMTTIKSNAKAINSYIYDIIDDGDSGFVVAAYRSELPRSFAHYYRCFEI
jgi:hypothetical protein